MPPAAINVSTTTTVVADVEAPLSSSQPQQAPAPPPPPPPPHTPCSLGRRTLTGKLLVRDEPLPPVPALEDEHQDLHTRAFLSPPETFAHIATAGADKKRAGPVREGILGLLAGSFVGLGFSLCMAVGGQLDAELRIQNTGMFTLIYASFGFPLGLTLCVVCGASLFTSNCGYMAASFFERRASLWAAIRVCAYSYICNALGALALAQLYMWAQVFAPPEKGAFVLELAAKKTAGDWGVAFTRGVLCNYLVVLAIWQANAAQDVCSKAVAIFLPISAFVALGYEHCVANLFLFPLAMMLQSDPVRGKTTRAIAVARIEAGHRHAAAVASAALLGMGEEGGVGGAPSAPPPPHPPPPPITTAQFLSRNLVPVTLGNIVGGALFVATAYAFAYGAPGRAADAWVERRWARVVAAVRRRFFGKARGGGGGAVGGGGGGGGSPTAGNGSGGPSDGPVSSSNGFHHHSIIKQRSIGVGGVGGGGVRKDGSASALLPAPEVSAAAAAAATGTAAPAAAPPSPAARVVRISLEGRPE
jgi:formate/nitrite transporter